MKLATVTKIDKRNKKCQKIYDDVMSTNFDVIVLFPVYGQFEAIRKPDSRRRVCKTYISISTNLLS